MKLRMRPAGAFLLLAGLSACDIPTGIPRWETTWITPGKEVSVSVVELLPSGLGVNADTSAFVLTIDPVSESWSLSDFCPACPPVTATAPKPAFTATVSTTAPLPSALTSADVEGGEILIELVNGFDFDPIRPGAASDSGTITITISSGATTVATLVVDGDDQAFAPGDTLDLSLDFLPSTIANDLDIDLTLVSPAGDVATLSPSDALSAEISSNGVLVSEAVVSLSAQPITGDTLELDLEDVDVEDRINGGTIFLDVVNPFGVTGNLTMTVRPEGGAPIVKPVVLTAGSSTVEVDFTEAEIQSMIGHNNTVVLSGNVNGGAVTVRPDMEMGVTARLRLVVELGGESDEGEA